MARSRLGVAALAALMLPPSFAILRPALALGQALGPCPVASDASIEQANLLMRNRYRFRHHPEVVLPTDPTWRDPLPERNWLYQLHSLGWTEHLWFAWERTGDARYRDRYVFILSDWARDNPRSRPPSRMSWDDHATANRGIVLACALRRVLPAPGWLEAAAVAHGQALADEGFYVQEGNHALRQAVALLDLACTLAEPGWRDLAHRRLETLAHESIDEEGVNNEQSDWYHAYNHRLYTEAIDRMAGCGLVASPEMRLRVAMMPRFTAWISTPGGRTAMIGDTPDEAIADVPLTEVEFVTSGGTRGIRPIERARVWTAGYATFRSGWGERRPLADETAVWARFGPTRRFHGHRDAASVLLSAYGDRLLLDAGGPFRYMPVRERSWVRSERAHNTVTVKGARMRAGPTSLIARAHGEGFDFVALRHRNYPGLSHVRRVLYSRELDVVLVDDDLTSRRPRTFQQWWHLHPDAHPQMVASTLRTRRPDGPNVMVRQLVSGTKDRIHRGDWHPIQGWITPRYGSLVRAPVAEFARRGAGARFVTLIVPAPRGVRPSASVRSFRLLRTGFDLVLRARGKTARIQVTQAGASQSILG